MKNYKAFILAATCLISFGCTSFLKVDTLGKSTIGGFFSDIDGLRSAGTGLHYLMLDFVDDELFFIGEVAADKTNVLRINADLEETKIFDFDNLAEDTAGYPRTTWKSGYEICTNANNILTYGKPLLEKYPESKDIINSHFAYALFARAYIIFCLTNIYAQCYGYTPDASHLGVVPIDHIPGFDETLKRSSVADCYSMVIRDLEEALRLFGSDSCPDPHYINGLACEALLARVMLYKGEFARASELASKVIEAKPLTPREDYVNMFRKAQDVTGSEAILRLNSYNMTCTIGNKCNPTWSTSALIPEDSFLASFESGDIRRDLYTYYAEEADGEQFTGLVATRCCKYIPFKDGVEDKLNRRCDPFVLRVSEMYLIRAEAECRREGGNLQLAADDLKTIRARALGKDKAEVAIKWDSSSDLDRLIQEEKAKELYLEGHRFFDIKRRQEDLIRPAGSTSLLKTLKYPDYRFALPINQLEMEANVNIIQNDGYTGRKTLD